MTELDIAIRIVERAFAEKTDRGAQPYYKHCLRVRNNILKDHPEINEDTQIIAVLHDLLEDCPEWNEDSLRCIFSRRVVEGVVALTKHRAEIYDEYLDRVLKNTDAILVKKYDLLDNMDITRLELELTNKDFERLKKYHNAYKRIKNSF